MEPLGEMKLTTLGVDCLERIFRYLPLDDLMNVADSNKQLKEVADLVFVLKRWNKSFLIFGFASAPRRFVINHDSISSVDLKIILQMLRCFGHLILKLEIYPNPVDNVEKLCIYIDHITFYIKQYCAKSLIELNVLKRIPGRILNCIDNPLPNVRSACVQSYDLPKMSLIELFPKIKRLTYICDKITDFASIESIIPYLDHLEIITRTNEDIELFRTVRLESELQSLSIPFFAIYQGINEILPHLKVLKVNKLDKLDRFPDIYNSVTFHFKTVKRLEIRHYSQFTRVPLSFDNLEEFALQFIYSCPLDSRHEKFYDFLRQHPSIIKMTIEGESVKLDLLKLINMLPVVREVEISGQYLIRDVIRFLNEKKTLKILKVSDYFNKKEHAVLQMKLNKEWHLVPVGYRLMFKRK